MASDWKTVRDAVQLLNGLHVTGADATPQDVGDAVQAAADAIARLEAEHKRLGDDYLKALEEIEAWKNASGLERGGDPDAVKPADMEEENQRLRADAERLAHQVTADKKALHDAFLWAGEWPLGQLTTPSRAVAEAVRRLGVADERLQEVRRLAALMAGGGHVVAKEWGRRILAALEPKP